MQIVHFSWGLILYLLSIIQVIVAEYNVTLSHDGPVVLGGTITFKVDLYEENGERPSGTFKYMWRDNALRVHEYETVETTNTTSYWSVSYPHDDYNVGIYEVEVVISKHFTVVWWKLTSVRTRFYITEYLNGGIKVTQPNRTVEDAYISSASEANMTINIREGDMDYLKNATTVSTYWFLDCAYYGQTNDFTFLYNFTSDTSHLIEALVVASHEPLTTTTVSPPTTTSVSPFPNVTTEVNTTLLDANVTVAPISTTTTLRSTTVATSTFLPIALNTSNINMNGSLPYICANSSIIPPDPGKTYGHFRKKINVRAPILNITSEGTHWIQPWDMLSLNITCKGSGPFYKCLHYHRGIYNVTGNETCESGVSLRTCNFSITHYFLEPSVYTILIIINNEVSKQVHPLTINIYKVTTKPQLSVIVVPVSCSLAAVVLIVFGIAYYIQSRARFTVEVADFDFGQNNPEMEYKTFTERLRDSFNNAIRPGSKRISGYKPLSNPEPLQ